MMDRNREARRGSMAAVNGGGGGLSRRRQQQWSSNLRDSPEEDGAMEMQESSRLRDRGVKKDRDRDRSGSRSKRRRGERLMHGSNREEGDDTSEESVDDDDDDEEEDASVSVRLPPPANSPQIPSASSSIQQQQQQNRHHVRKSSFPTTKPVRPPMPSWNVTEEMIGVSIPRKARSSSVKRSQECWVSGGGSGSGELINRQASTSPARPSPSSNTAISPSSSNVSVRKKKLISGTKQRPPKIAKTSASSIQEDIEKEVAEVLFGMTRHAPPSSNKQDHNRVVDYKDMNGLSTEAKSRVSSPNSISQTPATSQPSALPIVATAPKRKRPQLKLDEGSPTSPASSVAPLTKTEPEIPPKAEEESSPKSEKNHPSASPAVENGHGSCDLSGPVDAQDLAKPESEEDQMEAKDVILKEEPAILPPKSEGASEFISVVAAKASPANENPKEGKFSIDLMAPPLPEKPSSERDGHFDFGADKNSLGPGMKMLPANGDTNKVETASKQHGTSSDHQNAGNFLSEDLNLKKQSLKEKIPDLQLNLEKHDKEGLSLSCSSKQQQQPLKQQQKTARIDPKQERPAPSASLPLPLPMAGWPGGFPPFGYIGQVPSLQAVVQMDAAAKAVQQPPHFLQPQGRPKRCATHCYIAQNIHYHQQMARLNPFWSPAAAAAALSTAPLYGAKQYNLNAVPPLDSGAILGNPLQGGLPPRSSTPITMAFTSPPLQQSAANEKSSAAAATAAANGNAYLDPITQRKQFLIPPNSQPGSSMAPPNMIQGPAFLFPINQQQPGVANRSGVAPSKSTPVTGNAPPPPAANANTSFAASPSSATTMSFNYPGLSPTDAQAQYMAILQNSAACPFPIASPQVGGSTHYRGASPAQAMPFLNGPFYSSQMANPQQQQQLFQMQQEQLKQLQQQQSEQIRQLQQQKAHQNPSTSSGSSSSQKHTQHQHHHHQQQRVPTGAGAPPAGSNSQNLPVSKPQVQLLSRPENDTGCEDSPSTADSSTRVLSQAQKGGIYGQNFAMPIRSQNFALISLAAAALAGGSGNSGSRGENKQQQQQHQGMKVDLTPSQAYAMSFASFGGSAAAAAAASASGLDFSAIVQNPALLQNLPEAARHGYQIPAAAIAAAAAAAQSAQHKKAHLEDGKSAAAANANRRTDDAKPAVSGGGKSVGQQHSLTFSRSDEGNTNVNVISNLGDASARALNHLHVPPNGARALNQPSSAPTLSAATNSPSSQHLTSSQSKHQYNQMIQFQQQQQRMMQQQQQQPMQMQQQMSRNVKPSSAARTSTNNNNISSTAMAAAAAAARLPQGGVGVGGFPPSVIPVGGSSAGASNSPQWKPSSSSSSARTATAALAASATSSSSSAKNQIPQQQQHTQISFGGVNTSSHKPLSSASASAVDAAGSPQNSLAKTSAAATAAGGNNSNSGSPRASSSSKSGQPPASVLPTPLQHQQAAAAAVAALSKNSSPTAASTLKPSSSITNNSNNRNNSSILGHPNITPSSNSITKKLQQQQQQQQSQQQQQQQHHLPKQPFQQSQQPFFNNPYIQAQTSQRRLSEQQQQQQQQQQQPQNPATSGMLSLSASSDPTKSAAATANNAKGLTTTQTQAGILHQHTAQYAVASMAPHPFMSSFPYIHSMQSSSVSVKPSSAATPDQKQSTAGNENVHACWKQPEKR